MAKIESSRQNDAMLDWQATQALDDGECFLVALDSAQIAVILSLLRYAEWPTRWRGAPADFTIVTAMVAELEHCLMAGCNVAQLVQVLDEGFQQQHEDMQALKSSIDSAAAKIELVGGGDLEDDLANVWRQVEQVTLILGGAIAEAPLPL